MEQKGINYTFYCLGNKSSDSCLLYNKSLEQFWNAVWITPRTVSCFERYIQMCTLNNVIRQLIVNTLYLIRDGETMKKTKKLFIIIGSIVLVMVFFITSIACYFTFFSYRYNSDVEAVSSSLGKFKSIIYKYETNKNEIVLYNSVDHDTFECTLSKQKIFGNEKYKIKVCHTSAFVSYDWKKVNRNLKYVSLRNEEDIKNFDCEGYEPIKTKITYTIAKGCNETRWVYVIDKTGEGAAYTLV